MITKSMDPLLDTFLAAKEEAEAQHHLQHLLDAHILPKVRLTLRSKLGSAFAGSAGRTQSQLQADQEDLQGDILAQLLSRLQEVRKCRELPPIQSLPDYVAVTAHNAVNLHLRKRYPKRHSLATKLRYLCEKREGLAIWKGRGGEEWVGFACWRDTNRARQESRELRHLREDPEAFVRGVLPREHAQSMDPTRLLTALLDALGHPLAMDELVPVMATLWGVRDTLPETPPPDDQIGDKDTGLFAESPEQRTLDAENARTYWEAIRLLPPFQCAALLLQARDSDGNALIELLLLMGVVSIREMAQAMNFAPEELAGLWKDLPINDPQIAVKLGVTAQHVARLRMLARRNLAARTGE